jgi:predicted ATP-grasp superfamily ATP-dependent carboligase
LSIEGQIARQDWLSEKERCQNLGKVPIPQYDTKNFTEKVVDLISSKDIERFISSTQ